MASPPNRRGSGRGLPNDSLDAMRLDFLNDYNKIMQATDLEGNSAVKKSGGASSLAYFSGLKQSRLGGQGGQQDEQHVSPLGQMIAAGNIIKANEHLVGEVAWLKQEN